MKIKLLNIISIILMLTLFASCELIDSGDSDSNSNRNSSSTLQDLGTGTVSGTVNDDAVIVLQQSDGSTQEANTTIESPDFIFENVPEGSTTITINNGSTTTTQEINVAENQETQVNPFGSTQEMADSFTVNVYEVNNEGWMTTVASILTDSPLGETFYSKEINIPTRIFNEGFPGVTDRFEWFGVIYEGQIKAPVDGTYTFKVTSDDGSKLYINDEVIVNGDGLHSPTSYEGTVELTAGEIYDIDIKYFQGPREHICLVVEAQIPGEEMKLLNLNDFSE